MVKDKPPHAIDGHQEPVALERIHALKEWLGEVVSLTAVWHHVLAASRRRGVALQAHAVPSAESDMLVAVSSIPPSNGH